jgi:hypothetical protein
LDAPVFGIAGLVDGHHLLHGERTGPRQRRLEIRPAGRPRSS